MIKKEMDIKKIIIILLISLNSFGQQKIDDLPKVIIERFGIDIVPNEKTAIKLTKIIFKERFVNIRNFNNFKPFEVKLICEGKVWEVKIENKIEKPYKFAYFIRINKNTGEVLNLWDSGK